MAKRGRPPKHPQIVIVETGEIFSSYNQAALSVGGHRSAVYLCAIGARKTHKGFHFEFLEDEFVTLK